MEQPKNWAPSPDQDQLNPQKERRDRIEGKFGPEILVEAANATKAIYRGIEESIDQIGLGDGSSQQQQEQVRQLLDMWAEFSRNVQLRIIGSNASPETLETTIKGANALLSPEPTSGNDAPRKMQEALERRYGK